MQIAHKWIVWIVLTVFTVSLAPGMVSSSNDLAVWVGAMLPILWVVMTPALLLPGVLDTYIAFFKATFKKGSSE